MNEKILEWMGLLEQAIGQYAPAVGDMALMLARIESIKTVFFGLLFAALAGVFFHYSFRYWRSSIRIANRDSEDEDFEELYRLYCKDKEVIHAGVGTGYGLLAVGFLGSGAGGVLNIYAWIGMFDPLVWLSAKALGLT